MVKSAIVESQEAGVAESSLLNRLSKPEVSTPLIL
jgi:hypothetical protein